MHAYYTCICKHIHVHIIYMHTYVYIICICNIYVMYIYRISVVMSEEQQLAIDFGVSAHQETNL